MLTRETTKEAREIWDMVDRAADSDNVNHPSHYTFGDIEVLDAIEAWGLGYHLGNVVKYVARADHKGKPIEDLEKALFYLGREILNRKVQLSQDLGEAAGYGQDTEPGDEIDDLQPEASLPPNFWTNLLEKVKGKS